MARQIHFRGEAGTIQFRTPQAPNIAGAAAAVSGRKDPGADVLGALADAGRQLGGAVVAIAGRRMEGHIEDAYIEARRRFSEWRSGYDRTHQASQALDAQADYARQWEMIAGDVRKRYGDYLEGGYKHLLDRKLELGRLYATDDGARYQDQQFRVWGENQQRLQLSNLDRLVQADPDNLDRIHMELDEAERAWRQRNPGQDSTVFRRGLEEGIAAGRVQAMIARGDLDGAQAALAQYGGAGAGGDWNRGVAAEAARRRGTPHGGVGSSNDCSAYTGAIWKPYIADPKARQAIFGPDGGRSTSENIVQETANRTQGGRTLGNMELSPGMVGPGMVIGLDTGQRAHDRGRRLGIDHIVSTYMGADGRLMVTESSSDKRPGGGVHDTPYDEWYKANSRHRLYGASLVPLMQGGGGGGGGGAPAGGRKVYDISAPVAGAIESEAQRQGVDPAQALVICQIESSGNMNNRTGNYHGLFQLSEEDTREFGRPGDNRHDQATNIRVGVAQWKRCMQEFNNDPHLACVAYNRGIGAARKWVREGADVSRLPPETQAYLKKFDRYMAGIGGQRGAPSQPQQAAPVKMSPDVKETYDAFMEQVNRGLMPRERLEGLAEEWAQDKSPKVARRGREILAALRQSQPQAGAPAAQAVQQPAYGAGRPSFGGGILSPDKAELLQRRLDSARELQTKERARATAQDILAQTAGFTPEEQKAKAYALLAGQPAEVQAAVKPLVDSGIKFREDMLDAQYGASMAQFLELAPKLSPMDRDKAVDGLVASGKLSRKKADELRSMNKADLERVTPDKEKAFEELLEAGNAQIALGAPDAMTDTSDIDREFARGRLTPQMRKDLIEMRRNGGSLKNFGKSHLDDLYCDMQGKKRGTDKMPAEMYARFFKWGAASGKPLDDDAIKRRLADENLQVAVPGYVWGTRKTTLADALNRGLDIQGVEVPPEKEDLLTQEMQRRKFTPEQIQDPEMRRKVYANIVYGRK